MKKTLQLVLILTGITSIVSAQTLPNPSFSYLPCYGAVGETDSIVLNPVPGATGYIWDTNPVQSATCCLTDK